MRGRNLYQIDEVLLRTGGLCLAALLTATAALAFFDLAKASSPGPEPEFAGLAASLPLLLLAALCPLALVTAGLLLRRREKRIAAIWSLLEQNAEIAVAPLLANSNFTPWELERAVRFLNDRGLGHYVWDRENGVVQDGRLRSLQLHVEKCELCSATVSIHVPIAQREVPSCPYCGDPVSVATLQDQRRQAIAELRREHRSDEEREAWRAGIHAAETSARARPGFSLPLFLVLLVCFWPAAVGYALYQWQR